MAIPGNSPTFKSTPAMVFLVVSDKLKNNIAYPVKEVTICNWYTVGKISIEYVMIFLCK